jgi:hypothetical protein
MSSAVTLIMTMRDIEISVFLEIPNSFADEGNRIIIFCNVQ